MTNSILAGWRRASAAEVPEIGWGGFSFILARATDVLIMRYEWRNNAVVCMHNLSAVPREVTFAVKNGEGEVCTLVNLLSENHSQPSGGGKHQVLLEPYGYRWYRVCGLDYLLKRSPVQTKLPTQAFFSHNRNIV